MLNCNKSMIIKMEELKIDTMDDSIVIVSENEQSPQIDEDEEVQESPNIEEIEVAPGSPKTEGRRLRHKRPAEDLLHRTKNKAIKKNKDNPVSFKSEKQAEKFYLNINKNIKVKPVLLETIFEEEEDETEPNKSVQAKQLGKASKRTLIIKDGFNITKALTNKRKSQIKKKFGSRKKPKKVALKKFMEDFKQKTLTHECDLI